MRDENGFDEKAQATAEPPKSKTRRKKEMIELQKTGERLTALPPSYLRKAGIPSELLEAVLAVRKIPSFGARRRQMQHIGVLMREVDAAFIERVIEEHGQPALAPKPAGTTVEVLARSLVAGTDNEIEALIRDHPDMDRTRLRRLVRNARPRTPEQGVDEKGLKALMSYLAEVAK